MAALAALVWSMASSAQMPIFSFDDKGGNFSAPINHAAGIAPYATVAADFNADGKLDLAVGNENSDDISVLLAAAGGTFAPAVSYAAGDGTQGLAVGDFNDDGHLDLAAPNLWSSTLSILLGDGQGGFGAATNINVGPNPHQVAVEDLNGDGKLDVVTANGGGGISVLLGIGGGSFAPRVDRAAGTNPRDVGIADLNADAKLDLVVTNEGGASVSVLLGDGAGGFSTPSTFAVGARPQTVSIADFNADGKVDLAVPSVDEHKVSVLFGDGSGAFAAGAPIVLTASGNGATADDVDGDGHQDLLVTVGANIWIYLGNGSGAFAAGSPFQTDNGSQRATLAHLDADARPDLAVANSAASNVSILLNASEALLNVAPSASYDAGASYTHRKVPLWIKRQTSTTYTYPSGYPFSHAGYADIDRDGDTDFLRTFSNNKTRYPVQIMINDGAGGFTDQTVSRITGTQPGLFTPRKVISGDYNNDGWPDFFVVPHGIDAPPFPGEHPQLFLSNGDGTLRYAPGLEAEVEFHHGGASADIDGNGTLDIVLGGSLRPFLLLNDGAGNFTKNTLRLPRNSNGELPQFIAAELIDVDVDGFIDLMIEGYEPLGRRSSIYWGSSTGLYRRSNMTQLPPVADMGVSLDFAIEDIDRDGRRDVIVNRTGSTNLYVGRYLQILRQTAPRQFADETIARMSMQTNLNPFDFIRAQDINRDGAVDLFVDDKNEVDSGEYAWINSGQGFFTPYFGPVKPSISLFSNSFE